MAKSAASWGKRPTDKALTVVPSVDQFVNGTGKTARLNCIIPEELHKRTKVACANEGISMTDVVVAFLEERFPKKA